MKDIPSLSTESGVKATVRIVYVLGAGASHALVRTPLGADLVWTYCQDCDPLADESSYREFLDLAGNLFPEFCGESQNFDAAAAESAMYFAPEERLRKCHYVDEILKSVQEQGNAEGVALLQHLILKHITSTGNENHGGYELLKQHCLGCAGTSVVSFNFDTFLNERRPGPKFDYRLSFDWQDENRISYAPQEGIPLIKLNGSLDWAVCCNGHLGLLHYFVRDNTFTGTRCGVPNCRGKIDPLIITPHASHTSRFASLWEEAGRSLTEASKIVIIGYSFPDYDTNVIELFRSRLRKSTVIEIIDMKANGESEEEAQSKIRTKFQQLFPTFPTDQLTIQAQGLVQYLRHFSS
jgi:hypothetical protein